MTTKKSKIRSDGTNWIKEERVVWNGKMTLKKTKLDERGQMQKKRGQNELFQIKDILQYYKPAMVLFSRLAPLKFAPVIKRYI